LKNSVKKYETNVNVYMTLDKQEKAKKYQSYLSSLQDSGLIKHMVSIGATTDILNNPTGTESIFEGIAKDEKTKKEYQAEVDAYYKAWEEKSPTGYGITSFFM